MLYSFDQSQDCAAILGNLLKKNETFLAGIFVDDISQKTSTWGNTAACGQTSIKTG